MELFADTSNKDLYVGIFDHDKLLAKIHIKNLIKKIEPLINEFKILLSNQKININQINKFYINIGPGSFTGSRTALIFFKTIAGTNNKKIYICNSFNLIAPFSNQKNLYLEASKFDLFEFNTDLKTITIIPKKNDVVINYIKYDNIENNFSKLKQFFKEIKSDEIIDPLYLKSPQIGVKK
ncbi:hypothetical protein [Mycoplasma elephantis]|uniref:hypothetical protein n=1 Tax=Mycoplasma elephantis TaxID=114882 RepID=UPI0004821B8C|nr:hypothetical protein [Mycoplasma elephantis]